MTAAEEKVDQTGVIPYRWNDGRLQFLLITSRTRRRWIIPKGNLEPDLTIREAAAEEAREEAGVRGAVSKEMIGSYDHGIPPGTQRVGLFLLEVNEVMDNWPEAHERQRHWFYPEEAERRFYEKGLRRLIEQAETLITKQKPN